MMNVPHTREIIRTDDGSASIFAAEFNEPYHSRFGAITESMHIYIRNGLYALNQPGISVFELGFGTGLNAFLTLTEAGKAGLYVNYETVELYPLPYSIIKQLDYASRVEGSDINLFLKLHETEWDEQKEITNHFVFKKINTDFSLFEFKRKYDLFYFDAFAPLVQPELWTQNIFNKISEAMNQGAFLVTYSAMGEIRRKLLSAGLEVNRISGPPGKREILQAYKS
jgi:tRNA U34 5-methylaminomethyl-2-thiouridine-forming methyltransferase MnmC